MYIMATTVMNAFLLASNALLEKFAELISSMLEFGLSSNMD
jgi:hypothetical protein